MNYRAKIKISGLPYTKLNPNVQLAKGKGKARFAPHKPLLLLCIIDLADEGMARYFNFHFRIGNWRN
jgi:hypothetical protein